MTVVNPFSLPALVWQNVTYATNITTATGYGAVQAATFNGACFLRGALNNGTGAPLSAGSLLFTLPAAAAPATKRLVPYAAGSGNAATFFDVNTDGTVKVTPGAAAAALIAGNVGCDGFVFSL